MWTLTYMSIRDEIKRLEHDGKLFCLESGLMGEETPRTLWMSQEVRDAVILPPRVKADRRLFEFRQFLDSWLEYSRFSVAEDPDTKPSSAMLARVHPVKEEFWDFRVTAPKPGIRAIGAFGDHDTFIVLTWEYREFIPEFEFSEEVQRCMDEWTDLFGEVKPLKGKSLNAYLSNYLPV